MKYRSYNSELLICTTLMVDVFNDIIIDRRKHGVDRDWSQIITLKDIVQQKIEVPCLLGDRGVILKSLENEPGRYKMPLIILQMKDIRTDTNRMFDLHSDIFYQQDDSFTQLDYDNPMYRPTEFSKRRAQPINISYDATFITKYREDLDQIISNFSVHFRPDIYVRWWHPRIRTRALESQVTWGHSVTYDTNVDYNPQNVFVYKGTSSFTIRSWLFYGMNATDNTIDPELEPIIKNVKIFPNRDEGGFPNDSDYGDDIWAFGDYLNTPSGVVQYDNEKEGFGFYPVDNDQDFIGDDPDKMQNGQYAVNNVYAEDYAPISGDPVFQQIKTNPNAGDMYTTNDRLNNYQKNQYQIYLNIDKFNKKNVCLFKNVYFKGSFPQSAFFQRPISGDFIFKRFFKSYVDNPKAKAEFGDAYNQENQISVDYNIETKDLTIWSDYSDGNVEMHAKSKFNSVSGHFQEFSLKSTPIAGNVIQYAFHREYDEKFNLLDDNRVSVKENIKLIEEYVAAYSAKLLIEEYDETQKLMSIYYLVKEFWNVINLQERPEGGFEMPFEDPKYKDRIKDKGLSDVGFSKLDVLSSTAVGKDVYQILANKYMYVVLKSASGSEETDIYDFGVMCPLQYAPHKALIYEVTIPESRELMGLNLRLSL